MPTRNDTAAMKAPSQPAMVPDKTAEGDKRLMYDREGPDELLPGEGWFIAVTTAPEATLVVTIALMGVNGAVWLVVVVCGAIVRSTPRQHGPM
jgi:hypothetical protein